jgi:2-amino-4-hydroxy-6-hydroxymethyldihydropteridine diphosphokinase
LLTHLQFLEKEIGRQPKKVLNEPRVIDLDLIAFGQQIISTPDLILPHPRAHLRSFVLAPLSEIWPDYVLPAQQKTVSELLRELDIGDTLEEWKRPKRAS